MACRVSRASFSAASRRRRLAGQAPGQPARGRSAYSGEVGTHLADRPGEPSRRRRPRPWRRRPAARPRPSSDRAAGRGAGRRGPGRPGGARQVLGGGAEQRLGGALAERRRGRRGFARSGPVAGGGDIGVVASGEQAIVEGQGVGATGAPLQEDAVSGGEDRPSGSASSPCSAVSAASKRPACSRSWARLEGGEQAGQRAARRRMRPGRGQGGSPSPLAIAAAQGFRRRGHRPVRRRSGPPAAG